MKNAILTTFVILDLLFSHQAMASSQITANKTITGIATYKYYSVVTFTPAASGGELGEGCAGAGNMVVLEFVRSSPENVEGTQEQFSSLLSAYISKSDKVGFGVSGCRQGNGNNLPLIYRVDM